MRCTGILRYSDGPTSDLPASPTVQPGAIAPWNQSQILEARHMPTLASLPSARLGDFPVSLLVARCMLQQSQHSALISLDHVICLGQLLCCGQELTPMIMLRISASRTQVKINDALLPSLAPPKRTTVFGVNLTQPLVKPTGERLQHLRLTVVHPDVHASSQPCSQNVLEGCPLHAFVPRLVSWCR